MTGTRQTSATKTGINPIVRVLPSLADFAFLMPLLFLFGLLKGAATLLGDSDTGWHLRTGEWILANGRVPHQDLFSFTKPGEPWFAWEWLWDALFALVSRHGGLASVVLVNVVLLGAVYVLLYRLARRESGSAVLAIAATLLAAATGALHWLARPHILTLLFTVAFYSILKRAPGWRGMAALAGLTVLWANLHGGFVAGIALAGLFAAGECCTAALTLDAANRAAALRRSAIYAAGAAGCGAASLLNPYGWALHAHIFGYLTDPSLYARIIEFRPLDFANPAATYFKMMLFAGLGAAFWSLRRRRFTDALVTVAWAHFALISARHIPIYAIVAAPVIAAAAREWVVELSTAALPAWVRRAADRFLQTAEEVNAMEGTWRVHAVSAAAVVALGAGLFAGGGPRFRAEFPEGEFPARAVAALGRSAFGSRIFTSDQWGGYLIYRLYPNTRVFVDGRSDLYGAEFAKAWTKAWHARDGWQDFLERQRIDTVLLPPDAPLAAAIKESRRWQVVFCDRASVVYRPAAGEQVSAVGSSSGSGRDREITKRQPRGPEAATNTTDSKSQTQEQTT